MSANKFENQVHQKMDELRLQPSAQVWEEVERRIREKRRRRLILFWFLFAGLLLAGGGTLLRLQQNKRNEVAMTSEKKVNSQHQEDEIIKPDQQNVIKQSANDKQENNHKIVEQPADVFSERSAKHFTKENSEARKRPIVKTNISAIQTIDIKETREKKQTDLNILDEPKQNKYITTINDGDHVRKIIDTSNVPVEKPIDSKESLTLINKQELKEKSDSIGVTDVLPKTNSKNNGQQKNKWDIGLSLGIGKARLTDGKIGVFGAKSLDAYAAPNTSTGGASTTSFADSIPLKGMALEVGISAQKKLGKKTAFSTGLNFSYYSNKQGIGSFKDSVLTVNNDLRSVTSNGFYQRGNSNSHLNKYYYLQVPLLLHWQINKGNKLAPLIWENGFIPSILLSSHALAYDKSAHIFYSDKRLYNSFSLVYQTAFSTRLFKNDKHPLSAGIYYNYHLSMLQKISPPKYNYQSSYGIKLNWVIKK